MSRVAKAPIAIPKGVTVEIAGQDVKVKGAKGTLEWTVHPAVTVAQADGELRFVPADGHDNGWAMAGTTRALLNNMVVGCSAGFVRKLTLVGVGYRAQAKGDVLNLSLGFSHPIDYPVPAGITIETPSQTEIVVAGADKQRVGQVASEIRGFRPPEPL
jgi:large subunit ribosomal protein L6